MRAGAGSNEATQGLQTRSASAAAIIALAHALGGVMGLPEMGQQLRVADGGRVEDHQHHFVVAGLSAADFLVAGVGGGASGVADRSAEHPGQFPEAALGTPEAAHAEHRLLQAAGKRWLDRVAADRMGSGHWHGGVATGRGGAGRGAVRG